MTSLPTPSRPTTIRPRRSDIWLISLDPTIGAELQKTRPAVVISADAVGVLPVKLVVPLTGWNASYRGKIWLVEIEPTRGTGLDKVSAADVLQMRSIALERFVIRQGRMPASLMDEIAAAIAAVVEYQ